MLSPEITRQIRLIEIQSRRLAGELFAGSYKSVFHGQGTEYSDLREYQEGDDIRFIDWNVMARTDRLMVKKYQEDRQHTVLFSIDQASLIPFGSRIQTKQQLIASFTTSIALSAQKNNDKVGLCVFSDRIEHYLPPQRGKAHLLRLLLTLLRYKANDRPTHFDQAFSFLVERHKRSAVNFLLSDRWQNLNKQRLGKLHQRHDVIAVRPLDPLEKRLPAAGLQVLQDPRTGRQLTLDLNNHRLRERYQQTMTSKYLAQAQLFKRLGIDLIDLETDAPLSGPLMKFFRQREAHRVR